MLMEICGINEITLFYNLLVRNNYVSSEPKFIRLSSYINNSTKQLYNVIKLLSNLSISFYTFQDTEICRQFDFREQTFLVAMDTVSSLLRNCKQLLCDTAKQMTLQVLKNP